MTNSGNRRPLNWSVVRGPKIISALLIATAGGAGLAPWAPGTMGAVVGGLIAYLTRAWPTSVRVPLWIAILAVGTWAAEIFDEAMRSSDNQNIVVDEVVGMGITAWTVASASPSGNGSLAAWIAAFLLFRLFDVWKPFPIRLLDRWSHKSAGEKKIRWLTGFWVMADDVLAGVYGLVVMILLQHFGLLL